MSRGRDRRAREARQRARRVSRVLRVVRGLRAAFLGLLRTAAGLPGILCRALGHPRLFARAWASWDGVEWRVVGRRCPCWERADDDPLDQAPPLSDGVPPHGSTRLPTPIRLVPVTPVQGSTEVKRVGVEKVWPL